MKKKIWLTITAVIVLLAGGYSNTGDPFIAYHNHCLKQHIHMISKAEVTLNKIIPFEWDTVYTFDPYTSRSEIEEIIGFPGSTIQGTVSEDVYLLSKEDTKNDSFGNPIVFYEGMHVSIYSDDADEEGPIL